MSLIQLLFYSLSLSHNSICISTGTSITIIPADIEGGYLYIPPHQTRQVTFMVVYVEPNAVYEPSLLYNGDNVTIGSSALEEEGYISIVRRSCASSNSPSVRCELLQLTVYGRPELDGSRLTFVLTIRNTVHYTSGDIMIKILGMPLNLVSY